MKGTDAPFSVSTTGNTAKLEIVPYLNYDTDEMVIRNAANTSLVLENNYNIIHLRSASHIFISPGSNMNFTVNTSGTGRLQFGTRTATSDAPITGYIEIKDSGGTTRKLAVIS